ncbi:MAG: hypothetical protein ACKO9S_02350, partial [Bacteroidota bacterium]
LKKRQGILRVIHDHKHYNQDGIRDNADRLIQHMHLDDHDKRHVGNCIPVAWKMPKAKTKPTTYFATPASFKSR